MKKEKAEQGSAIASSLMMPVVQRLHRSLNLLGPHDDAALGDLHHRSVHAHVRLSKAIGTSSPRRLPGGQPPNANLEEAFVDDDSMASIPKWPGVDLWKWLGAFVPIHQASSGTTREFTTALLDHLRVMGEAADLTVLPGRSRSYFRTEYLADMVWIRDADTELELVLAFETETKPRMYEIVKDYRKVLFLNAQNRLFYGNSGPLQLPEFLKALKEETGKALSSSPSAADVEVILRIYNTKPQRLHYYRIDAHGNTTEEMASEL